jgi:hypothetical protein
VLSGIMLLAIMALIFYLEAELLYNIALHYLPTALAVILDIFLLFAFYFLDAMMVVILGTSAVILIFDP